MTAPDRTPAAAPIAAKPDDPATLVVAFGNLVWMAWVWVAGVVAAGLVIFLVQRYGNVEESLFDSVFAGWQRWIILAAGVVTATTLLPMLVTNGATRGRVAAGTVTGMLVIATLATAVVVTGYGLESLWYDRGGWSQEISGGSQMDGAVDLAALGLRFWLTALAYFSGGWLIGIGFYRWGTEGGLPMIPPALVPVVLCEMLLTAGLGPFDFRLFDEDTIPLALGAAGAVVVIGIAVAVARNLTRSTPIRI